MTLPSAAPATAPTAADTAAPGPATMTRAPAPDEVAAATPANAGARGPKQPEYKQEVSSLLDAYEAKQARLSKEQAAKRAAAPEPEPQGLLEGESWDGIYKDQPPEVQRAMAELRKTFTRKTQKLAAEQRKLEAQNRAFMESGLIEGLQADAANMPTEFDPFNPDHIKQVIEARVASRLQEVLQPLHQTHQKQEAANRYQAFRDEHPDLVENEALKTGVYKALQADPSLKLEAAYWATKGKMLAAAEREATAKATMRRRAAQRAASMTDHGRRPGKQVLSPDLKDQSAWDIYQTLKSQQS